MGREQSKRTTAALAGSSAGAGADAIGPIVSSAHLAAGALPGLSEVEFGLILAGHAFDRWMMRCMGAAGVPDLSAVEVLVLHTVRHRDRPKKLADICLVLGIEDTHVVSYAIKKLALAGLVTSKKAGKEKLVTATKAGADACQRYHEIRERLLVKPVKATGLPGPTLSELGGLLRALSGHYDQAARSATSL
ncbi:MAG TPA: winged helix DNA-binding protein [Hyphomicrobiaceae bacterium]|jgi:predicted MarR family transcription regulator|nr:winged helix DNA-binding protein [Hyphomicrobiaceae bacterium]